MNAQATTDKLWQDSTRQDDEYHICKLHMMEMSTKTGIIKSASGFKTLNWVIATVPQGGPIECGEVMAVYLTDMPCCYTSPLVFVLERPEMMLNCRRRAGLEPLWEAQYSTLLFRNALSEINKPKHTNINCRSQTETYRQQSQVDGEGSLCTTGRIQSPFVEAIKKSLSTKSDAKLSTVLQRLKLGTIKTQSTTQWRSLKPPFALTSGQQLY